MTLMIGQGSVVSMRHTLKSDGGEVVDSSNGNEPMVYLHGANNLIPGLEAELNGKTSGANICASILPDKAYGELSDELIQVTSKSMFQGAESIEPGISFVAQGDGGAQRQVRVTRIEGDDVTIDANYPLARQALHFEVEVVDVREGTPQEIELGHVHAGGEDH